MTYAERVRAWCGDRVKLRERVLKDGRHHVWFHCVYRFDSFHDDFEFACRVLWGEICHTFPFGPSVELSKGAPMHTLPNARRNKLAR